MATYGNHRQVPKSATHGADTMPSLAAPRHQSPRKQHQPGYDGKRTVEFEPGQVVRKGNIALDGAPKRLQGTTPVHAGMHGTHVHQHVDAPNHGEKFNLAGVSSTQAAAMLNGDKEPTTPPDRVKVLPAPEVAFGMKGAHGQGLNHDLGRAILSNSILSGSSKLPTKVKAQTAGK